MTYLLDTNVCIHALKQHDLIRPLEAQAENPRIRLLYAHEARVDDEVQL